MNAPIRRVAVACLVLFAALLVNVNYIQAFEADSLKNKPGNSRVLIAQYQHDRGPIVVGGDPIVESTPTNGQYKYQRVYKNGPVYAPVTGFYSMYSATGIEKAENSLLDGTDGRLFVRRMMDLITGKQPKGASVVLTLNKKAQLAAYDGLRRSGMRGAVVALDPKTGAILAMVSLPSYDPNRLASHDGKQVNKASAELLDDPANPMLNRAINEVYPPGSTFKIVTTAAALSDGYRPDQQIPAPTALQLPLSTARLHNFGGERCGDGVTDSLTDALVISCNTAFADLGIKLGADRLAKQAEAFGLNDPGLTVPLPVSESFFPTGIDKAQTALSAIGQYEVRITPLQAAMIAAAVANHGVIMKPYLIDKIQAPDLSVIQASQAVPYKRAMNPEVAAELTGMMEQVVQHGTGTAAQIPGIRVAGKTGTAQNAPGKPPHAWFISFAPADDPQVAVAVIVENGGNLGSEATGGAVAAPIAKAVMEAVLGR